MATADVLVLRSTRSDDDSSAGAAPPSPGSGAPAAAAGPSAGAATATTGGGSWPAAWLPGLLRQAQQGQSEDDAVRRHRRAHLLTRSGCRYLDVTAVPSDPTAVRLTVVWDDGAPSAEERAAFVSWWVTQAAALGWQPSETDDLVGSVEVVRYLPADLASDLTSSAPGGATDDAAPDDAAPDVPGGAQPQSDHGGASRTSGRRT